MRKILRGSGITSLTTLHALLPFIGLIPRSRPVAATAHASLTMRGHRSLKINSNLMNNVRRPPQPVAARQNLPNSRGLGLNSSHGRAVPMSVRVAPGVQRRNSTEYSNAACFRVRALPERALGPDLIRNGLGRPPANQSGCLCGAAAGPGRRRGTAAAAVAATAAAFRPDAVHSRQRLHRVSVRPRGARADDPAPVPAAARTLSARLPARAARRPGTAGGADAAVEPR